MTTPALRRGSSRGLAIENMTPRQIVAELDKYVVGQQQAKRAVAIALRNRWRRQQLPPELAEEIAPKNILMIGPTGVGKTEIARRLARLAKAPFLKVEASKFTEVGYVGRDVESMVRDLVEIAVTMVKEEKREAVREAAAARAEDRLLQLLVPPRPINGYLRHEPEENEDELAATREKFREKLRSGALDNRQRRDRGGRDRLPEPRDVHPPGGRGGGHQHQGDAPRPLRPQEEAAGRRWPRRGRSCSSRRRRS